MTYCYKAFNMIIESDIPLPMNKVSVATEVDVMVAMKGMRKVNGKFIYGFRETHIPVPSVADFHIRDGRYIDIYDVGALGERILAQYVLNSCFMIIFQQRGLYPVHGMAVALNDHEAIIVAGMPHAGKSSLGQTFMAEGYQILSDDLTPIDPDLDPLRVYGGHKMQRFWLDSIEHFGIAMDRVHELYGAEGKCAVYTEEDYSVNEAGYTILGIIELSLDEAIDQPILEEVPIKERVDLVMRHTYRKEIYNIPQLRVPHFIRAGKIAKAVDIFSLRRPSQGQSSLLQLQLLLRRFSHDCK